MGFTTVISFVFEVIDQSSLTWSTEFH
ncbi:hypothetical protein AZE42_11272 [Rhizopogon vesiculosus]|uniref:Uncharacterized protein n=1 Tax=Rhizopogon vesiculosus TaxID=180088 RepID=A0A1J8QZ13_9AGAM|nr:hypothetical protein AZE42_11272 [Rhizopogon vesiculosus]